MTERCRTDMTLISLFHDRWARTGKLKCQCFILDRKRTQSCSLSFPRSNRPERFIVQCGLKSEDGKQGLSRQYFSFDPLSDQAFLEFLQSYYRMTSQPCILCHTMDIDFFSIFFSSPTSPNKEKTGWFCGIWQEQDYKICHQFLKL